MGSIVKNISFSFILLLLLNTKETLGSASDQDGITQQKSFMDGLFENSLEKNVVKYPFLKDLLVPSYATNFLNQFDTIQELSGILLEGVTNQDCIGHTIAFVERIKNASVLFSEENLWALKMLDAYAKVPEGILSGHINPTGDYDECIEIRATDVSVESIPGYGDVSNSFQGKYCTVYLVPPAEEPTSTTPSSSSSPGNIGVQEAVAPEELLDLMSIREGIFLIPSIAVCFPSTCSNNDIQLILSRFFNVTNISKTVDPFVNYCSTTEKPDLDAGDISVIVLLGILFGLCIFAGIVDAFLSRGENTPKRRGLAMQYFMAFSLYTNIRKWLTTRSSGDDLGCVHGIRFFSTVWVVLAHTWYMVTFLPVWNMVDLKKIHEDWPILIVLNSTVAVDTFFVLSGMLVAYNLLKLLDKSKGKINIPMFYVHRYLRLTPTYAILIGIMATILPYFGSGPFYLVMERWSTFCEDNWWTNLLYVNNFVNTSFLCQGEAWYLADDMQFYIVSPLFLYPLWKWETIGLGFLGLATFLSILCPGLQVYFLKVPPTTIGTRFLGDWFTDVYIKPWSRIQTYFVGVFLGYILFKTKGQKVKVSKLFVLLGWIMSTGTCLAVLFGIYPYFDPRHEIPEIEGMIYAGLSRFGWGVSIAWIIFACVKGYGGLVNSFLSWKVFMPLGRLCFCVFLVSLHLQMLLHLSFRQAITFEPYSMTNFFFAHLVMSFMVGFVCTMTMESPFIIIEKLIFEGPSGGRPPKPEGDPIKRPTERYGIFYNNTETVINNLENQTKT